MSKHKDNPEHIVNGNRFIRSTGENSVSFPRDPDRLYARFEPLRANLYNRYSYRLQKQSDKEELISYINEQFHRLVVEFIHDEGVDFPGYVATKLEPRVRDSFLRRHTKMGQREGVPRDEDLVMNTAEAIPSPDSDMEYYEVMESIFKNVTLSELEEYILYLVLDEKSNTEIEENVKSHFDNTYSMKKIKESTKEVKDFLRFKLEAQIKAHYS